MNHRIIADMDQLEALDFIPTMAVAFYDPQNRNAMRRCFRELEQRFPGIDVIGSSSGGNFHSLRTDLKVDFPQMVWILMQLDGRGSHVIVSKCDDEKSVAIDYKGDADSAAIIMCSLPLDNVVKMVQYVKERTGVSNVFGSVSGAERIDERNVSIFYNGSFLEDSMLIWFLDHAYYSVRGCAVHDFEPMGMALTVTKAVGNRICEIENEPALKMLENIIGPITNESIDAFQHPLALENSDIESECSEGSSLMSLFSVDRASNCITLFKSAPEGSKLRISIPIRKNEIEKRRQRFVAEIRQDGSGLTLMFVCIGIKRYWQTMTPIHMMQIGEMLDMDMVGHFTFGEIGMFSESCESQTLNQTYTAVTIVERKKVEDAVP